MTLILELTPEQERELEAEARRRNLDTRTYVLARLFGGEAGQGGDDAALPEPGSLTPVETVTYWERMGILRPRPDLPDSPAYARQLREEAQNRIGG